MKATRSGLPLPVTSATARPAPWFCQENQSGMVLKPAGTMPSCALPRPEAVASVYRLSAGPT